MKYISLICGFLFVCLAAQAATPQLATLTLSTGQSLAYYISAPGTAKPSEIMVALHGYKHDANRTFEAMQQAVAAAGKPSVIVVAPIFAVTPDDAARCQYTGVPAARPGNALWTCSSWMDGGKAQNGALTSFAALDELTASLHAQFPAVAVITVAGFSAGGQFVQHYVAFARPPAPDVTLRFVVADPGSWLYFDTYRPQTGAALCPGYNNWKLGLEHLPPALGAETTGLRAAYAKADVQYLEGGLDDSAGPGTFYKLLAKKCGDELQGPYRLQRGAFYAAYDDKLLAHGAHHLTIVPGCAHNVSCVFPSPAARAALFGN